MDAGTKEALEEQLRIGQALKRKIRSAGGAGRGQDEEDDSTDASDDEEEEEEEEEAKRGATGSKKAKLKVLEILSGEKSVNTTESGTWSSLSPPLRINALKSIDHATFQLGSIFAEPRHQTRRIVSFCPELIS